MIKVDINVIKNCANNLMFDLSEDELSTTVDEFSSVLDQINFLSKIKNVDSTEPLTFPYENTQSTLRNDTATKCLTIDQAIGHSNSKLGSQIKIPKVIGNDND